MHTDRTERQAIALLHVRGVKVRGVAALVATPAYDMLVDGAAPTEFRMLAAGINPSEKGDFLFDAEAAASVMSFWGAKGVELAFDYEHQSLSDPPVIARAAGWFTPEIRNGELWATNIRWTDTAKAFLEAREYRYFSPAFVFDEKTNRVERIVNCALTNNPALNGIEPLMAASANAKETAMDYEKLYNELKASHTALTAELASLKATLTAKDDKEDAKDEAAMSVAVGLTLSAGRPERLAAVTSLATLRKSIRDLTSEDNDAGAIGKLTAWKSDAGAVAQLRADSEKAIETTLKAELESILDEGAKAGKVPPSEEHALRKSLRVGVLNQGGGKLTKDGVAWLKGMVSGLGKIAPGSEGEVKTGGGPIALSANSREIAKRMGIDATKFAEFQTKRLAARAAG